MFTTLQYKQINRIYKEKIQEAQKKTTKIFTWIIIVLGIIAVSLYIVLNMIEVVLVRDDIIAIIVISSIVIFFVALMYLLSFYSKNKKVLYTYVYKEVVDFINEEEGTQYQYQSYIKDKELTELVHSSNLFPKGSVNIKFHVSGYTKEQRKFDMFELSIITNNGKTSTVHFDGIYYVIHVDIGTDVQIRNSSKPHRTDIKYTKVKREDRLKMFKPEDLKINEYDQGHWYKIKNTLNNTYVKYAYLSTTNHKINYGIQYASKYAKKPKVLTLDVLNSIESYFKDHIEMANTLETTD